MNEVVRGLLLLFAPPAVLISLVLWSVWAGRRSGGWTGEPAPACGPLGMASRSSPTWTGHENARTTAGVTTWPTAPGPSPYTSPTGLLLREQLRLRPQPDGTVFAERRVVVMPLDHAVRAGWELPVD